MPPKNVFTWPSYYTRMNDVDPDHRQMALFDLTRHLQTPDVVIGAEEDKLVDTLRKCFTKDEHNSEVHSQAVKILPLLFPKIQKRSRDTFAALLSKNVWDNVAGATKEELQAVRENASMALKTLSEVLTEDNKDNVDLMVQGLIPGLNSTELKIRAEIFEVLVEIVRRFGGQLQDAALEAMQTAAIKDLGVSDDGVQKRATALLANVCAFSSDANFAVVVDLTVNGLSKEKGARLRRHIRLCSAIARAAGGRFAGSVTRVIPLLLTEIKRLDTLPGEEREAPESDDTREQVLQAFECFIARCPHFVTGMLSEIVSVCALLIKWDPNYCDDGELELQEEDEDDTGAIDDDDTSWKVRKAAAKCTTQILNSHPASLSMVLSLLFAPPTPLLVSRLNERIENVRLEVFEVFRRLLELSCIAHESQLSVADIATDATTGNSGSAVFGSFRLALEVRPEARPLVDAQDQLVRSLVFSANHRSVKIKVASFAMLHDLFMLLGRNLSAHIGDCATLLKTHLSSTKYALPNLRPEVLRFARCVVVVARNVPAGSGINPLQTVVPLLPSLAACMDDRFFKTVVAAIKVALEFVGLLRGSGNTEAVVTLFRALKARMAAADSDVEVKKAAVEAIAMLIRYHNDALKSAVADDLNAALESLLGLLKHDATRVPAARAFALIGGQSCISAVLAKQVCAELALLLRRADRAVREAALRTLIAIVPVHGKSLDAGAVEAIARELVSDASQLLSEKELFLASLSLQLCGKLARIPGHGPLLKGLITPKVIQVLSTPFAQGHVVREAAEFYRALTARGEVPAKELTDAIMAAAKALPPAASSIHSLATIVGSIVAADANAANGKAFTDSLADAAGRNNDLVALACLGEIGRGVPLTTVSPKAVEVLRSKLASTTEDVRIVAAVAFGRAAASECGAGLFSSLITDLSAKPEQRLTLLRAVREALATAASETENTIPFVRDPANRSQLTQLLLQLSENAEEGSGDLFSECVGRIAQLEPASTITELSHVVTSAASSETRIATALGGLRHAIGGNSRQQVDDVVQTHIDSFFGRLHRDQPLRIRRQALHLLLTVAYSRPALLMTPNARSTTLPAWMTELEVDRRFITEVDLGPFKHKVDKGIEIRKLAFETLSTLADGLTRPPSVLEVFGGFNVLVARLVDALKDPDSEIVSIATASLVKLSRFHAGAPEVAQLAPQLFDGLKASVMAKDPQEPEKAVEISKTAITSIFKIVASIPELASHPKFVEARDAGKALPHFEAAKKAASE